ncbi:MAG: AAA family ATPase [Chloroflexales bacterium]|nr:AAA family ATPase [Chloroflexales bacterium]
MPHLAIRTLGGFQAMLGGSELTRFESDKARALLIYLALEGDRPHRRETLINLFWPNYPERQARRNLSQTLLRLRQVIQDASASPPFLLITPQTIQFNLASDYWLDATAFQQAFSEAGFNQPQPIAQIDSLEPAQVALLQHTIRLYRGDFLAQFFLVDSLEFETWTIARREELCGKMHAALEALTQYFIKYGSYGQAEQNLRRQLEIDPFREPSHRALMRVLASSGQRAAALLQYDHLRQFLDQELGVEPEDATTSLAAQIRTTGSYEPAEHGQSIDKQIHQQKQALGAPGALALQPMPQHADRRQITVLCCDLVGLRSEEVETDPEVWHEALPFYQQLCLQVVEQFGGYLMGARGGYLVVYFGFPKIHEDSTRRAVQAGLALVSQCGARITQHVQHLTPDATWGVRVSIHTGSVVAPAAGSIAERASGIVGNTLDIAADLLHLAPAQTVLISIATYRLVRRFFVSQSVGVCALRGSPRPMGFYHVLQENQAEGGLPDGAARTTALVGRDHEVQRLRSWWNHAQQRGHNIFLGGEAGVGKSRLIVELDNNLADTPHLSHICRCSPYHRHTPFYVVIDMLQHMLQLRSDESHQVIATKLEAFLERIGLHKSESDATTRYAVPLLGLLLGLPTNDRSAITALRPEQRRQQTMEVIMAILRKLASHQPVLLVIEDLHWADPSSLELVRYLTLEQAAIEQFLAIYTFRSDFQLPWLSTAYHHKRPDGPQIMHINLAPLSNADAAWLVKQVAGDVMLPDALVQHIVQRADGIPLYIEELTKTAVESLGNEPQAATLDQPALAPSPALVERKQTLAPRYALPDILHDSLMARLDQLGPLKEMTQLASTFGREFSYGSFWRLWQMAWQPNRTEPAPDQRKAVASHARNGIQAHENSLLFQDNLKHLEEAGILSRQDSLDDTIYSFKHALVQEAAYSSMLTRTRQCYHRLITQVFEAYYPEVVESQPELVAQHYAAAGAMLQAIECWQRAGRRAIEQAAHIEARTHLQAALDLVRQLPRTAEHANREFLLLIDLGMALMESHGYGDQEVQQTFNQAYALCQHLGYTDQTLPVLRGLWTFHLSHADLPRSLQIADQIRQLAQHTRDPVAQLVDYQVSGFTLLCAGDIRTAHQHLEQAWRLYTQRQGLSDLLRSESDYGVTILTELAHTLWHLGYPDQGLQRCQEALALARERKHSYDIGFALVNMAWLHWHRLSAADTEAYAAEAIQLASTKELPYWLTYGRILHGWALAVQGNGQQGIAEIEQALDYREQAGMLRARSQHLAMLAEACAATGEVVRGHQALDTAIEFANDCGERLYLAELLRLKGDFLLRVDQSIDAARSAAAEESLTAALDAARQQGAKIIELRAALSLGRVWARQGRCADAQTLVAETYAWFSEGLETMDLRVAQAFLSTYRVTVVQ